MPAVPQLSLSNTEFAGVGDFLNISVRVKGLEERNSLFCLDERLSHRFINKGNILDLFNAVSPRARTRDGRAEAARAETTAKRSWF